VENEETVAVTAAAVDAKGAAEAEAEAVAVAAAAKKLDGAAAEAEPAEATGIDMEAATEERAVRNIRSSTTMAPSRLSPAARTQTRKQKSEQKNR
jgi:hypothetical protein